MAESFRGELYWGIIDGYTTALLYVIHLFLIHIWIFGLTSGLGAGLLTWLVRFGSLLGDTNANSSTHDEASETRLSPK
jgi:hypothetical protein